MQKRVVNHISIFTLILYMISRNYFLQYVTTYNQSYIYIYIYNQSTYPTYINHVVFLEEKIMLLLFCCVNNKEKIFCVNSKEKIMLLIMLLLCENILDMY
jgi:uncharacterized protein with PQ loop repeat